MEFLEPQILPYPEVIDKYSNHELSELQYYEYFHPYEGVEHTAIRRASTSVMNRNNTYNGDESDTEVPIPLRARRRSSFRIRRVSTSSNRSDEIDRIDPLILDRHATTSQNNMNYRRHSNPSVDAGWGYEPTPVSDSSSALLTINGNNVFEDDEIYDIYNDINTGQDSSPARTIRNNVILNYSNSTFIEENNISGIDWVEDENGSALVIGTDYGIMKWNINSWARRSFSSYDFC